MNLVLGPFSYISFVSSSVDDVFESGSSSVADFCHHLLPGHTVDP